MPPQSIKGKGTDPARRYRSDLRRQQAEQTRQRIAAAAAELFAAEGYTRTTMAKIASAAGVSAETVQGYGPKAALMVAAVEYATFAVSGEENFLNLEIGRRFLEFTDRDDALGYLLSNTADLHERSVAMWQALIGAAATDPELDRYLAALVAGVTKQNRRILTVCRERGWLRTDRTFDDLVYTYSVLAGIETFVRLRIRGGWSLARYSSWLRRMVAEAILRRDD